MLFYLLNISPTNSFNARLELKSSVERIVSPRRASKCPWVMKSSADVFFSHRFHSKPRRYAAFVLRHCFSVLAHVGLLTLTILFYLHSLVTSLYTAVICFLCGGFRWRAHAQENKGFTGNDTRIVWMKFEMKICHMPSLHVICVYVHTVWHVMT